MGHVHPPAITVASDARGDERETGLLHESPEWPSRVPICRARERRQQVRDASGPVGVRPYVLSQPRAEALGPEPALERGQDGHALLVDEAVEELFADLVEALHRSPDGARAGEPVRPHHLLELSEVVRRERPRGPVPIGDAVAEELRERLVQPRIGEPRRRYEGSNPLMRHLVRQHHRRVPPSLLVRTIRVLEQQIGAVKDRARFSFAPGYSPAAT